MKKAYYLIGSSILVIAFAFLFGFRIGKQQNSTNNSLIANTSINQTQLVEYSDPILPLMFEMPTTWSDSRIENDSPTFMINAGPSEGFYYYVRFGIADNPDNLSAQNYALNVVDTGVHDPYFDGHVTIGKNKEYEGWRVTYVFTTESKNEVTYIEHNDQIYFIERLMRTENDTYPDTIKNYDVSDQILSTLEFTDDDLFYSNSEAGYSLSYPSIWTYSDSSNGNPAMFYDPVSTEQTLATELLQGSKIEVYYETTDALSLEDAVETKGEGLTILSEEELQVDGTNAIKRTEINVFNTFTNVVYILKNQKLYSIVQYIPEDSKKTEYTKVFDQLLDSFKFVN